MLVVSDLANTNDAKNGKLIGIWVLTSEYSARAIQ